MSDKDAVELPDLDTFYQAADRIRPRVPATPSLFAHDLSAKLHQPLWIKLENLQPTGSFKIRGAMNWLSTASQEELSKGLITVSAGNHALALAWAARQLQQQEGLKIPVTVIMPEGSSELKIQNTRKLGARVIVQGTIQQAVALCHQLSDEQSLTLVHPYDDPRIMAGQGSVALELLEQIPNLQRVIVPVGGAGLISGMGLVIKALKPEIEVIGVEPEGAATLRNAWNKQSKDASLDRIETIAVSLGPARVGRYTYAASCKVVDKLVSVKDASIIAACLQLLVETRTYVETGAATGLAAILQGKVARDKDKPTAMVLTGGNMDLSQLATLIATDLD